MPSCAVAICQNTTENVKSKESRICFHRFPLKDIKRAQLWFSLCKRRDRQHSIPKVSDVICSEHFTEGAYIRDLRNELLGLPQRKKLKSNAVPTLNLPKGKSINLQSKGKLSEKSATNGRKKLWSRKRGKLRKLCSVSAMDDDKDDKKNGISRPKPRLDFLRSAAYQNPDDKASSGRTVVSDEDEMKRVKNDSHCQTLLQNMFNDETLMDVTLIAQEKHIKAHRVVLRHASCYFKQVLSLDMTAECEVRFRDIDYDDLRNIISFIYQGEVSVKEVELNRFLKVAQMLEVSSLLPWAAVKQEPVEIEAQENDAQDLGAEFVKEEGTLCSSPSNGSKDEFNEEAPVASDDCNSKQFKEWADIVNHGESRTNVSQIESLALPSVQSHDAIVADEEASIPVLQLTHSSPLPSILDEQICSDETEIL